jgi:hypothetical protein
MPGIDAWGRLVVGSARPRVRTLLTHSPNVAVLRFALPRVFEASVAVFDGDERRVRTLIDGTIEPGEHACRWDGRDDFDQPVAPGTYTLRLTVDASVLTSRRVVID